MGDMIVYIMFGGVSFFMFFLFFYVLKVEKMIERKFAAFELTVEELNKEVYLIKKELKRNDTLNTLEEIEKIIETIVDDIKTIEETNKDMYESLKEEIAELSNELKKNKIPEYTNISRHEEEKIINMYKSGYKVEEISRELRIPAGEIELILKFANIV
ncbi:hypothetical protein C6V80_07725 [Caminibacter pacificus]|uniref:DUF2802 domain-containing protein n=4 Tax=Caminibacter pacificus TaxID=1424653 RepID=A0ABX5TL76_9BACT|nr:hypothetical protein [Campylobacterota bacterium]QCI28858.1 hypothetical protein C6V80_07725 [Caminibacter pacificus]